MGVTDTVASSEYDQRVDDGVRSDVLPADVLRRVPARLHHAEPAPRQTAHGPRSNQAVRRTPSGVYRLTTAEWNHRVEQTVVTTRCSVKVGRCCGSWE